MKTTGNSNVASLKKGDRGGRYMITTTKKEGTEPPGKGIHQLPVSGKGRKEPSFQGKRKRCRRILPGSSKKREEVTTRKAIPTRSERPDGHRLPLEAMSKRRGGGTNYFPLREKKRGQAGDRGTSPYPAS